MNTLRRIKTWYEFLKGNWSFVVQSFGVLVVSIKEFFNEHLNIHLKLLYGVWLAFAVYNFYEQATKKKEKKIVEIYRGVFKELLHSLQKEALNILSEGDMDKYKKYEGILGNLRLTLFIKAPEDFHQSNSNTSNESKLLIIGRYASYDTRGLSDVKFTTNKGVCGYVFKYGKSIGRDMPNFNINKEEYIRLSKEFFNLKEDEVEKLLQKSGYYMGIPIKDVERDEVLGALVIDTKEGNNNIPPEVQEVFENLLSMNIGRGFYRKTFSSLIKTFYSQINT